MGTNFLDQLILSFLVMLVCLVYYARKNPFDDYDQAQLYAGLILAVFIGLVSTLLAKILEGLLIL